MKVVLLKSVDNLGQAGQAVEVRPGYFRNFLEPREMALRATPANMKVVESQKKRLEATVAKELTGAEDLKARLDQVHLVFALRAGEQGRLFGSVTARDVIDRLLSTESIEVERRRVEMENLKSLGDHVVRIRLYPGVVAAVKVTIERDADSVIPTDELDPEQVEEVSPAAAWVQAGLDAEDDD